MNTQQTANEEFLVTARKWRPLTFANVVGQDHISTTLHNSISSGRIHHAYLFCGPRGVGKTTSARIFARALNCTNSPDGVEPCNTCDSCRDMLSGRSMDIIEIDGASNNSVDDIRKLRENAKYPPIIGRYKMYIIDEVHMLSTSAFNALLKTLEEPPPHLIFVFATTESHKVPATIVSRCQRFDFRRMEIDIIVAQLRHIAESELLTIDEESLIAIAKKGDGSMRDSQSIFDQVRAFCGESISYAQVTKALHLIDEEFFFTISAAVYTRNVATMFDLVQQIISQGYDLSECLVGLLEHFRNILTVIATGNTKLIQTSAPMLVRYTQDAQHFTRADVLRIMSLINTAEQQLKYAPHPRVRFELLLAQLASLDSTIDIADILRNLQEIKKNGSLNISASPAIKTAPIISQTTSLKAEEQSNIGIASVTEPQIPYIDTTTAANSNLNKVNVQGLEPELLKQQPPRLSLLDAPIAAFSRQNTLTVKDDSRPLSQLTSQSTESSKFLSAKDISSLWKSFVQSLPTVEFPAIKMIFSLDSQLSSISFYDNEIVVAIEEEFVYNDAQSKQRAIVDALRNFYSTHIKLTFINGALAEHSTEETTAQTITLGSKTTMLELPTKNISARAETSVQAVEPAQPNDSPVHTFDKQNTGIGSDKLPIEQALISMFSAKKIPISSQ